MPMTAFDAFRCCFILLLCLATPARALEPISLQLNFTHQFQFAGYYAAIEQGYYREVGWKSNWSKAAACRLPRRPC